MRKYISYLSKCKRHQTAHAQFNLVPVVYKSEKPMKTIPSSKWFMACYVRDMYSRLDLLKGRDKWTSTYGRSSSEIIFVNNLRLRSSIAKHLTGCWYIHLIINRNAVRSPAFVCLVEMAAKFDFSTTENFGYVDSLEKV